MSYTLAQYPIGLKSTWHNPARIDIPSGLADWLLDDGSLTARLKGRCQHFRVEVLGQQVQPCPAHEANAIIRENDQVLVREVVLYCDDIPQVFARSLLPLTSLTGEQAQLASLGELPLGQVLFNHPSLQRELIEVAQFDGYSSVGELAETLDLPMTDPLWGRRSVFYIDQKPLMVAEVFLPGALAYRND